jgi:hypothetical protein
MPETLTARARWIALIVVCFGQFKSSATRR